VQLKAVQKSVRLPRQDSGFFYNNCMSLLGADSQSLVLLNECPSYFGAPEAYKGIPSTVPNPSIRNLVCAIGYVDW